MYYLAKETAEKTRCPANSKRYDSGVGYLTIERDLTSFHEAGELHLAVDWKNFEKIIRAVRCESYIQTKYK